MINRGAHIFIDSLFDPHKSILLDVPEEIYTLEEALIGVSMRD